MKVITNLLTSLYPRPISVAEIVSSSAAIAVISYLFLIVFQPFGTYNFSHPDKYILLLPYSGITFTVFLATGLFMKRTAVSITMLRQVQAAFIALTACSVFNYLYNIRFINHTGFHFSSFISMLVYTIAIGTPVCLIIILAQYVYVKNLQETEIKIEPTRSITGENNLTIHSDTTNESLTIDVQDFIFAESDGNYCSIFYVNNGIPESRLLRLSLKRLEDQIAALNIIRCHRSFMVNTRRIAGMKGNAQGYRLSFNETQQVVPVSRKYINAVQGLLKQA